MSQALVEDRRATAAELSAHWDALVRLGSEFGLSRMRLRDDEALVVAVRDRGYWSIARFIDQATELVGAYVYVVADDITEPAAG